MKHTETPWVAPGDGTLRQSAARAASGIYRGVPIASPFVEGAYDGEPIAIANAEFIARAVNSHHALVAALENMVRAEGLTREDYEVACAALAMART